MPQTAFSRANFNPRSRVGNDHILRFGSDVGSISIHVPAWGTTKNPQRRAAHLFPFQSTFPRGERQKDIQFLLQYHYFNPRSRVGNDREERDLVKRYVISIHVPAWGTTKRLPESARIHQISIHVPAWGTTTVFMYFLQCYLQISIHVPAWGTTSLFR